MQAFGSNLRKQREFRAIELEEIAEATMINLRFLQAIEQGRPEDLPHPTFVKGFLRAYARHIGIDGDEVVLGYEQYLLSRREEENPQEQEQTRVHGHLRAPRKIPAALWLGLGALVLGMAIFIAWPGKQGGGKRRIRTRQNPPATLPGQVKMPTPQAIQVPRQRASAERASPQPREEKQGPDSPPRRAQELRTSETAVPAPGRQATPAPAAQAGPVAAEKPFELTVQASRDCWLLIQIDGEQTLDFILRAGQSKTLSARREIVFKTIGNRAAVTLSRAGESVSLAGENGQVLHELRLDARTDLKQLLERL